MTDMTAPGKDARAARIRAWLAARARALGRFRGQLLRRLVSAVGRPRSPRGCRAIGPTLALTTSLPSVTAALARLGLGLAGGGGGSPGALAGPV